MDATAHSKKRQPTAKNGGNNKGSQAQAVGAHMYPKNAGATERSRGGAKKTAGGSRGGRAEVTSFPRGTGHESTELAPTPAYTQLKAPEQIVTSLSRFIAECREALAHSQTTDDFAAAVRTIIPRVNVVVERLGGADASNPDPLTASRRMIVSADKKRANYVHEINRIANGLIVEVPSMRVLAMPTENITPSANPDAKNVDLFDIFHAHDGTIINLYWWSGEWHMGTANGFDVVDYHWIGTKTYREAFECSAGMSFNDFCSHLSTDTCYTFGFRFHEWHPLSCDPERVWFVQSVKIASAPAADDFTFTRSQAPPEGLGTEFPLQKRAAPVSYADMARENDRAHSAFLGAGGQERPAPHYGFILRYKDPALSRGDILLESSLGKTVRTLMYDIPKNYNIKVTLDHTNRSTYMSLKAFMCVDSRIAYAQLYPELIWRHTEFSGVFAGLCDLVVEFGRSRTSNPQQDPVTAFASGLAQKLLDRKHPVNFALDDIRPIVIDFLVKPQHLNLMFMKLYKDAPLADRPMSK